MKQQKFKASQQVMQGTKSCNVSVDASSYEDARDPVFTERNSMRLAVVNVQW